MTGRVDKPALSNAFTRFNQSIEDYPQEMDNMDDHKLYTTDNFERMKPLMPKKGSTVGTTTLLPTIDTDEKLIYYDTQGESLYTNPPDPNVPVVDHGLDELSPWSFRKSNYNQIVINNAYSKDVWAAMKESHAPRWGLKLATPAFFKREKFNKFLEQWSIRLDFEALKMRHARELRSGDMAQRDQMKAEVSAFLAEADQRMLAQELSDVYVTDHKPAVKKFSTLSDEEDEEYFNYAQSLKEYNQEEVTPARISRFESGRYERGSLKQRLFEPLAGSRTLDNGTLFYEVSEKELSRELDETKLRETFDKLKDLEALEGEEEADIRVAMMDAIESAGVPIEEWDKILARELNTFQEGEKYDYATDLRRTFDEGVSTTTASKIFKKIPSHAFWDIKKPLHGTDQEYYLNPYNPARKYPFESFFDMRQHEQWLKDKEEKRNINCNISRHTRL